MAAVFYYNELFRGCFANSNPEAAAVSSTASRMAGARLLLGKIRMQSAFYKTRLHPAIFARGWKFDQAIVKTGIESSKQSRT
jgi:hypothetical protein